MRRLAPLLILLAACEEPATPPSANYQDWKSKNFAISQTQGANPATESVTIVIDVAGHAKSKGDWIEVAVNGHSLAKTPVWSDPGKPPIIARYEAKLAPNNLNFVRFFSSGADHGWGFNPDPRAGRNILLKPDGHGGFEMVQAE